MTVLSNPKWERFAQELAKGKTADEAYQNAGYAENRGNATRLKANESVAARVAELQSRVAARVELTRADILQMLVDDRKLARESGQSSAAMKAAELLGRELFGMFIDRKEVGKPGEFANTANAREVEELIAGRLGLARPGDGSPKPVARKGSVRGVAGDLREEGVARH